MSIQALPDIQSQHRHANSINSPLNGKEAYKKTLFLYKLKDRNMQPILTEIDSHFNTVDKYLDTSGQLVIGKRIQFNEGGVIQTGRRASIRKSPQRKQKRNTIATVNDKDKGIIPMPMPMPMPNALPLTFPSEDNSVLNSPIVPYETIDNKKLKAIFDAYKEPKDNKDPNKPIDQSQCLPLPSIIEHSLSSQSKYLQIKANEDLRSKSMSKYLSHHLNKPESSLLINRIDAFRIKKEVLNAIDNQIPLEQKYGQYKWNISLRRPDRFKGKREAYINIRSDTNPFWARINERYPMHVQMSIKPTNNINSNDYLSFKKNPYLRATSADKVKSVESMNNLVVKGKDLYKVEYDNALRSQGNKILHRVFVHNGKNVYDKDINQCYGNEVLYEHYA